MTDPLIARLRALLIEWRQRACYSSHFADWHPRAAQDVKDAALGEGFAFGACADELAGLLVDLDAGGSTSDYRGIRRSLRRESNEWLAKADEERCSQASQYLRGVAQGLLIAAEFLSE